MSHVVDEFDGRMSDAIKRYRRQGMSLRQTVVSLMDEFGVEQCAAVNYVARHAQV